MNRLRFAALASCLASAACWQSSTTLRPGGPIVDLTVPAPPAAEDSMRDAGAPMPDAAPDAPDSLPADAAPSVDAGEVDAHGDVADSAPACTPITPDSSTLGCFGEMPRPTFFGTSAPNGTACSWAETPTACQCAETYNCACLLAHAADACAGSGTWAGCAMNDDVPVVTCQ